MDKRYSVPITRYIKKKKKIHSFEKIVFQSSKRVRPRLVQLAGGRRLQWFGLKHEEEKNFS